MGAMMKTRIDKLLLDRGLVDNAALAQRLLMAGQVRVNGQLVLKPSTLVDPAAALAVESGPRYVSRGGDKLEAGLQAFGLNVIGRICADVGASTGGFTDCLLQYGAIRVYAIDVGHGILEWKLRQDPRVVVMEGMNARHIERLPEPASLVTIDASFISLKVLLPVVRDWLSSPGEVIALIKPQFEAERLQAARARGVIRDPEIHRRILLDVLAAAQREDYEVRSILRSPLVGPKGNIEFLVYLNYPSQGTSDLDQLVAGLIKPYGGNV
jgi:23S rRNA (cytidine1920-2'-O)/16S rRNA (cytidine1409-2'-O)-methyltransferase